MNRRGMAVLLFAAALAACGGTSAEDAYDRASSAIGEVDDVRRELRAANDRIDELERKITELENADDDLGYRIDEVESSAR